MRPVSNAYLVAINADTEQTEFWAEFGFSPPGAREGMTLAQSGFGRWGNKLAQLGNRTYGMGSKWASLELNRSVLGQGWRYFDTTSSDQIGEWSTAQSGADGVFSTPPTITMTLDAAYDLIGVQIVFDNLGKEWATVLDVSYYNASNALIETRTFTPNGAFALVNWSANGVKKIVFSIKKWNLPRRFAKVCQVVPGQIRYFTGENTYSFLLREKISPFSALTIPEYTLSFDNENQEYNIINPEGAVAKLRELMEIPSNIGLITAAGVEYVSTGNFYLYSWPDNVNDETAEFNCRPDIAFANKTYVNMTGSRTVSAVAAQISTLANLHTPISVDASIASVSVNGSLGGNQNTPLADALGQLAIAAGGYVKFERDGTYTIKPLSFGALVRTVDYDNMWDKPEIKQGQILAGVTVKYLDLSGAEEDSPEEYVSSGNDLGDNKDVSSSFIATQAEAQRIGGLALGYYGNRLTYKINYRGDMSIEAGDVVSVETDYGFRNVLVLEHEISYDIGDFLQGVITGVEISA